MLEGKKYPQDICAPRLLTKEIIRPIFEKNELNNMAGLENILSELSAKSQTTKPWNELVIKRTLLIMQFTRATDEPDYTLLTATMNKMLPYFFAAHKHNYARYGLFICHSLTYLPNDVEQHFLLGEHILHHTDGLGMAFHQTSSLKPLDEARERSKWCYRSNTKPTNSGQHGPIVNMQL